MPLLYKIINNTSANIQVIVQQNNEYKIINLLRNQQTVSEKITSQMQNLRENGLINILAYDSTLLPVIPEIEVDTLDSLPDAGDFIGQFIKVTSESAYYRWDGGSWGPYLDANVILNSVYDKNNNLLNIQSIETKSKKVPYPQRLIPTITDADYRYPTWLSKDGSTIYIGRNSYKLRKSSDDMQTITDIGEFEPDVCGVRDLDNGELLVSTINLGDVPGALWLSSENQTVWTKVLEASSKNARFANEWGMSVYGNIIVVSEYGSKNAPDNARKVYLSTDYGLTWSEILDIGEVTGLHTHGCAYDPYYNRIWVSTGDDTSLIMYSDDMGATWVTVSEKYQVTAIHPMPDCVLFGSDASPNGILRYTRRGKNIIPHIEIAYRVDDSDLITCCCNLVFQRRLPDAPVYFSFCNDGVGNKPGFVIATCNGIDFYEVFRDWQSYESGKGFLSFLGPTSTGKLIGTLRDDRQSSSSLFKAEAQDWVDVNQARVKLTGSIVEKAIPIVPNNDLSFSPTLGLYVGITGHVKVDLVGSREVILTNLQSGVMHPLSVTRVYKDGTTATGILGGY